MKQSIEKVKEFMRSKKGKVVAALTGATAAISSFAFGAFATTTPSEQVETAFETAFSGVQTNITSMIVYAVPIIISVVALIVVVNFAKKLTKMLGR